MPGKMARSYPRPAFGLPEVLVAVSTSRLSCKRAGKTRTLMPVWDSSGESRVKRAAFGLSSILSAFIGPRRAAGRTRRTVLVRFGQEPHEHPGYRTRRTKYAGIDAADWSEHGHFRGGGPPES